MSVIKDGIIAKDDGTLSFGNYESKDKIKVNDFKLDGDTYYLKTHDEVTVLKKNETLLLEAVPGATVHNFNLNKNKIYFGIEGKGNTSITMELLPTTEYHIILDDVVIGSSKTNLSGKLSFSLSLTSEINEIVISPLA